MIEIFILSVIQGVTEFLPISSSSHLILVSNYLEFDNQGLTIDVSLHIGSFFAVILYFYKDLINFYQNKALFLKILISSLPIIIVGFVLVQIDFINKVRNVEVIAWTTILFGILLYFSDKFQLKKNLKNDFDFKSALIIGFLQILSLVPGVSRSGIAITIARLLKFKRPMHKNIFFNINTNLSCCFNFWSSKYSISEDAKFTRLNILTIFYPLFFHLSQ